VNVLDLVAVAHHLGRKHQDARYDVNADGRVTVRDLLLVVRCLDHERRGHHNDR
jgi:hypothetical protein